jgi:hypothetical protein
LIHWSLRKAIRYVTKKKGEALLGISSNTYGACNRWHVQVADETWWSGARWIMGKSLSEANDRAPDVNRGLISNQTVDDSYYTDFFVYSK